MSQVNECALYDMAIPVDEKGRCVLSKEVGKERTSDERPKNWKCCELCKALTDQEIDEIFNIKKVFERPLEEIKAFLHEINSGCQHGHYTKVIQSKSQGSDGECIQDEKEIMGHPIQCAAGMCESPLRLLRQAAAPPSDTKSSCQYIMLVLAASLLTRLIWDFVLETLKMLRKPLNVKFV